MPPDSTSIEGWKTPSGNDPSELDFAIGDYATLLVTAPDGTQTGFDPRTGTVLKGSERSAFFADDNTIDPMRKMSRQLAPRIPCNGPCRPKALTFTVQVNGVEAGSYEVTMKSLDNKGKMQTFAVLPGVASVGSTLCSRSNSHRFLVVLQRSPAWPRSRALGWTSVTVLD